MLTCYLFLNLPFKFNLNLMIKRYTSRIFPTLFLFLIWQTALLGQTVEITGKVLDSDTKETLPFVNITAKEAGIGTSSDPNGEFKLQLKPGLHNLVFSLIGYDKMTRLVEVKKENNNALSIRLLKTNTQLNTVVFSSSKYEQKQEELTTSVEVIKPNILENKNVTSIDKAIEATPGVAIIDNEPQIRGGSGFASGLGARVTILVDDMPLMRADAGRPVWGFVPVENVEQIEVMKGASSVLYGSSALNGAINVRTAFAKSKPETKLNMFGGFYHAPKDKNMMYYPKGKNPYFGGLSAMHARKLGKQVDMVVGMNFYYDKGFVGPEELSPNHLMIDSSYISKKNQGEYDKRGRVNFALKYTPKKVEGLSLGLAGNFMYQTQGETSFWLNDTSGAFKSFPGTLINFTNTMFYLDPTLTYFNKANDKHSVKSRYFYSNNLSDRGQNSKSHNIYGEYQYQRHFKKLDFNLITGVMGSYTIAESEVFVGTPDSSDVSKQTNAAIFTQIEKKFFKRLTLLAGARFEYFEINNHSAGKPVFRAGANLQAAAGTFIRASWGQGFRYPTIGERYIQTAVGGFGFYPNANLKPESSYNLELGFKQMFRIRNFVGFIDLVGFYQRYKNFVEFYAGKWGYNYSQTPPTIQGAGFQFVNTGRAHVPGAEITLAGMGKIGKHVEIQLLSGYTYTKPMTLDPFDEVGSYDTGNPFNDDSVIVTFMNSSSLARGNSNNYSEIDSSVRLLKYRIEHMAKIDLQVNLSNFGGSKLSKFEFGIGTSLRYYSAMRNIDYFFFNFDSPSGLNTGINNFYTNGNVDSFILDARISVAYKNKIRLAYLMNNVLNGIYVLRPMNVEAPRSSQLQLTIKI